MSEYKVPYRDMSFVLNEVFNVASHYKELPDCNEVTPDLLEAIIRAAGKFAERVLSPLNKVGDQQGCRITLNGVARVYRNRSV